MNGRVAKIKEQVRARLEAGSSRRAIADELKIDPSTVTRYARLLGFTDAVSRRSPFDWPAIQKYYDDGHTIDECRERFGFSYGAWDKAAVRGEIVTRPRSQRQLGHETRDRVEQLIADGLSQSDIARTLGLSKSTVAYHSAGLGCGQTNVSLGATTGAPCSAPLMRRDSR
jgi:transposase-like protein